MTHAELSPTESPQRKWYQALGPGLITACVVIGPGSILTSSQVGAKNGFDLTWIVVVSVIFMMAFMQMGARLGTVLTESPGTFMAADGNSGPLVGGADRHIHLLHRQRISIRQ